MNEHNQANLFLRSNDPQFFKQHLYSVDLLLNPFECVLKISHAKNHPEPKTNKNPYYKKIQSYLQTQPEPKNIRMRRSTLNQFNKMAT